MTTLPPSLCHIPCIAFAPSWAAAPPPFVGLAAAAGRLLEGGNGAGNEVRTRDLNLGKVALYQLSYSRMVRGGL